MKIFKGLLVIGTIEIFIGGLTLAGTLGSLLSGINAKSPNVLFFVLTSATLSAMIGIGILQFRKEAYYLLLYFSSVILLSKILVFMGVLRLNGALTASFIPGTIQNLGSFLYHGFVIHYLLRRDIKPVFHL